MFLLFLPFIGLAFLLNDDDSFIDGILEAFDIDIDNLF